MEKRKQYDNKIILPRTEEHELPKGKLGLVFCGDCNAVYYKKSWHNNLRDYKNFREDLPVKFSVCPACAMIKNKQFEGEIIISNIPANIEESLIHLIETFGRRAEQNDGQHRVIAVKKIKSGLIVTTTENQLAVKIAKKIKDTFKKVEMKISYSPKPSDVVYVKMGFK
ncbi:MAG: hypothetical protein M1170_02785 [Patescibacteria group bacterium]|nr:hypothetical protein [Patescibacteria group bacterium]